MMLGWKIVVAVICIAAVIGVISGLRMIFGKKPVSGLMTVAMGLIVIAASVSTLFFAISVQTYTRLTYERPVATVTIKKLDNQSYQATVTQDLYDIGEEFSRTYDISGDNWSMEARILKWQPWANFFGLDSQYKLMRISGHYNEVEQELNSPRSVYAMSGATDGVDIWEVSTQFKWLPLVDTVYGNAAIVPMADGAQYEVSVTQSGLIARPSNGAAKTAIANWK